MKIIAVVQEADHLIFAMRAIEYAIGGGKVSSSLQYETTPPIYATAWKTKSGWSARVTAPDALSTEAKGSPASKATAQDRSGRPTKWISPQ